MAVDGIGWAEPVAVVSDGRFELRPADVDSFALVNDRYDVVCSSGDRETGRWRGVSVADLVDRAGPAARATHVVVTGADGYRVCLPLTDSIDALVAVNRLDAPADDSLPRFLGSAVSGTRSVKRVRRLETVALAADEDPADYEALGLDD